MESNSIFKRVARKPARVVQADVDLLQIQMKNVDLNNQSAEDSIPTDDYYVHIDVLQGSCSLVSKRINSLMIKLDSFDPRRGLHFPTDLLEEGEADTLAARRAAVGVGDSYYEFWKVRRGNFTVEKFRDMVAELPKNTIVRLVRVIDNEHEITNWSSKKA